MIASATRGAAIASGLASYATTGSIDAAWASFITASLFFGAGSIAPENPFAHAVAGAMGGGIGAAITGGDPGLGMLVGAMAGFTGTYAGQYMKDWYPGYALIGRSIVGGVTGGIASGLYGGGFGDGFQQGAITAAFALIFNGWSHWIREWIPAGKAWATYSTWGNERFHKPAEECIDNGVMITMGSADIEWEMTVTQKQTGHFSYLGGLVKTGIETRVMFTKKLHYIVKGGGKFFPLEGISVRKYYGPRPSISPVDYAHSLGY